MAIKFGNFEDMKNSSEGNSSYSNSKKTMGSFRPNLTVLGIGGAGNNAINHMISGNGNKNINFIAVNTDVQVLEQSLAEHVMQIGKNTTKGLGAGAHPEIGLQAAEESIDDIKQVLDGSDMLFIISGMGGGTGTGASPVFARVAREMNILTIAFVIKPFDFEGTQKLEVANKGIEEIERYVDTVIIVSNQRLFEVADTKITFQEGFKMADDVLVSGISFITDLMISSGLINLDFNDVKSIVKNTGRAAILNASASGESRLEDILNNLFGKGLLEYRDLENCTKALISIKGDSSITLNEVDTIVNGIRERLGKDVFVNFGVNQDDNLKDKIEVALFATGNAGLDSSVYDSDAILKSGVNVFSKSSDLSYGDDNDDMEDELQSEDDIKESSHLDDDTYDYSNIDTYDYSGLEDDYTDVEDESLNTSPVIDNSIPASDEDNFNNYEVNEDKLIEKNVSDSIFKKDIYSPDFEPLEMEERITLNQNDEIIGKRNRISKLSSRIKRDKVVQEEALDDDSLFNMISKSKKSAKSIVRTKTKRKDADYLNNDEKGLFKDLPPFLNKK